MRRFLLKTEQIRRLLAILFGKILGPSHKTTSVNDFRVQLRTQVQVNAVLWVKVSYSFFTIPRICSTCDLILKENATMKGAHSLSHGTAFFDTESLNYPLSMKNSIESVYFKYFLIITASCLLPV